MTKFNFFFLLHIQDQGYLKKLCLWPHQRVTGRAGKVLFAPSLVQSSEHIAFYYSVAVVAQAAKQLGRECFYILFFLFFSFCQRLCDLTKRQDDIAVADMVADMAADMEVHNCTWWLTWSST